VRGLANSIGSGVPNLLRFNAEWPAFFIDKGSITAESLTIMKTRIIAFLCAAATGFWSATPAHAITDGSPEAFAADAIVARPACLAATVVGSAFFVVSLPFALISKSVNKTAQALVVKPARATFTRPMGEFGRMTEE